MTFTGADQSHCLTPWGERGGGGGGGAGNYAYKNCLYFSSFHAQVTGYELNIAPVMFSEHVIFVYLSI